MEKLEKITMGISFALFTIAVFEIINRQSVLAFPLIVSGILIRIIYRMWEKKKPEEKKPEVLECQMTTPK